MTNGITRETLIGRLGGLLEFVEAPPKAYINLG
jgi:hypothetical protein